MIAFRILFLLIFSFFLHGTGTAQSVEELIRFADQKYATGQYKLAAKEYQRALFFGKKEQVAVLNAATGDCYFQMQLYDKARVYYQFASNLFKEDSLRSEMILKKASCQLLQGRFQLGILDIFNLPSDIPETVALKKSFLLGIAYFGLGQFDKSEEYFLVAGSHFDPMKTERIMELFSDKRMRRPNPKLAYWLSVFVPGSGQMYSGDIKNGLNSFLLTSGLIVLAYRIAVGQSILDAILTVFPWFQRYYIGGYNSAQSIASSKLADNRAEVYKLIYGLFEF